MIDRTPKPCHHPQVQHRHGTYACYTLDGCRCLPCAFACSSYHSQLREVHAKGERTLVDPTPAADHIGELMAAGWTLRAIADKAGVSTTTVQRINSQTRRPLRIKTDVATSILAVGHTGTRRYMTPAVGVVRRVRALATLGWSFAEIARRAGISQRSVVDMNVGAIRNVRPATFDAICSVYDELWATAAPKRRDGITDRMIGYAKRNQWSPPMAWDDDEIDDPAASPRLDAGIDKTRRDLYDQGASDSEIGRRVGVSGDAIRAWRQRNGLASNYAPRGRTA